MYSSMMSLNLPRLYFEVVIKADAHSSSPQIPRIICRFFSKIAWWSRSLFWRGLFESCKSFGPSRDVEIILLCFFRYLTIFSLSKVRLVQMTNSNSRFLNKFCHSASSKIYFTISKSVDGSPPWNSILIHGEGDMKIVLTIFFAVFFVISAEWSVLSCLFTWQ